MSFILRKLPTIQTFTSGSGTYTTPNGVAWIRVRLVGGGGGGGSATSGGGGTTPGTSGGTTTFGTSLLTATGGGPGDNDGSTSVGGSGTINSPAFGVAQIGAPSAAGGFVGIATQPSTGYSGGSSPFGGNGRGGNRGAGGGAQANSGSGGGGSGSATAGSYSGGGGASGGYVDAVINNPLASYSYSVGIAGTGNIGDLNSGGAGAAGIIIVEEFYS